ncbi:MAG TPA: hypothetical protein VHX59_23310 [Mycobacteriales bacterium]|nr:hypothetical protein [Mycobacteriales bacterium]
MVDPRRRQQLQTLLAAELTRILTADGWALDPIWDCGPESTDIAAFRRPAAYDVSATVLFSRPSTWPAESSLSVYARIGASYDPLYRLWPELDDRPSTGEVQAAAETPDDVGISAPRDVPLVARRLADTVPAQATALAGRHASVDSLLAANRGNSDRLDREIEVVPALLAAAGRGTEARAALTAYRAVAAREVTDRRFRRFAYLLDRWLDAGAVLPDPPTGPAAAHRADRPPSMSQARAESRNHRDAVTAVRNVARGKSRDELRALLHRELVIRGVTLSALQIEGVLDNVQLQLEPYGQLRSAVQAFRLLGDIGANLVHTFRAARSGEPGPPAWLEPPDHALYPARWLVRRWVEVDLDTDAGPWLGRVARAASMRVGSTVLVDAWLAWAAGPPTAASRLAVHIGFHRVGTLDPVKSQLYLPIMADANRRGEHPYLGAQLADDHGRVSMVEILMPPMAHVRPGERVD